MEEREDDGKVKGLLLRGGKRWGKFRRRGSRKSLNLDCTSEMTLLPRKTSFRWKGISFLQASKKKRKRQKKGTWGIRTKKRKADRDRQKERQRVCARKAVEGGVLRRNAGIGSEGEKILAATSLFHALRGRRYESTITWHLRADSAFTSAVEFGTFTRGLLWLGRGFLTVWWKARDELALWSNILIPRMELSLGNLDLLPKLLRASQLVSRCKVSSFPPRRSYHEAMSEGISLIYVYLTRKIKWIASLTRKAIRNMINNKRSGFT